MARKIAFICLSALLLSGCSGNWGWYVVNPSTASGQANLKFLLSGLYYTVLLSLTAIVISIAIGRLFGAGWTLL